jgi:predicted O-methyltransferase YrrM
MRFDKNFLISLYRIYHSDLRSLESFDAEISSIGHMYHTEERKILYLLVRYFKPSVIVEFSPNKGWTTLHTAKALENNGVGHIYSFEIDKEVIATAIEKVNT